MTDVILLDNGGDTFDRYTAIYPGTLEGGTVEFRGMSSNPFHPQGFGQWGELPARMIQDHAHLGRVIDLDTAPDGVRRCIARDLVS